MVFDGVVSGDTLIRVILGGGIVPHVEAIAPEQVMGLKDKCRVRRIFGKLHTLPRQLIGGSQVA
jgi:hypothetical protein